MQKVAKAVAALLGPELRVDSAASEKMRGRIDCWRALAYGGVRVKLQLRSRRRRQPASTVVSSLWLSRPAYVSLTAAEAKAHGTQPLSLSHPTTATTAVGNRPADDGRRRRRLDAAPWPLLLLIIRLRDTVPNSRRNVRPQSAPASVRVSGKSPFLVMLFFDYIYFFRSTHNYLCFFSCVWFFFGFRVFLRRDTTKQRGPINKNFIGSRMGSRPR